MEDDNLHRKKRESNKDNPILFKNAASRFFKAPVGSFKTLVVPFKAPVVSGKALVALFDMAGKIFAEILYPLFGADHTLKEFLRDGDNDSRLFLCPALLACDYF